ncbi:4490_t:CDS:2 [Funneliformis mosseae]|uniref:4490_t:CDS:1 n=1 Tax=Funneliformis mosseae TaxID=27381 RepID=A0A9N9AGY5_FUNMO|nr:4490_t:CDS:2 [Funneliformis mosseae]
MSESDSPFVGLSSLNLPDIENDKGFKPNLDVIIQKISQIFNKTCVKVELIEQDSGYRIPFLIELEDGGEYILYVINPTLSIIDKYPKDLLIDMMRSEIGTINYLDKYTNIPVPRVYHWNLEKENEIGAPFMIVKKLFGNNLDQEWSTLTFEQKCEFINHYLDILGSLGEVRQDQIGSLYLDEENYQIGKLVIDNYVNLGRSSFKDEVNRGPFHSTKDFLNAAIELEIILYNKCDWGDECKELWVPIQEKMLEIFHTYWKDDPNYDFNSFVLCPPLLEDPSKILIDKVDGKVRITGFLEWKHTGFLPKDYLFNKYPHIIINRQEYKYSEEKTSENLLLQEHFDNQIIKRYPQFKKDEIRMLFFDTIIENFDRIWCTIDALRRIHDYFNIEMKEEWLISDDYFKRWFKENYSFSDEECNRLVDDRAWYNVKLSLYDLIRYTTVRSTSYRMGSINIGPYLPDNWTDNQFLIIPIII